MNGVKGGACATCGGPLPIQRTGRPRSHCDAECSRAAEHIAGLVAVLPRKPGMMIRILEQLGDAELPHGALFEADYKRLRSAAFTLGSRGRRLAPGTSGKYVRKT